MSPAVETWNLVDHQEVPGGLSFLSLVALPFVVMCEFSSCGEGGCLLSSRGLSAKAQQLWLTGLSGPAGMWNISRPEINICPLN